MTNVTALADSIATALHEKNTHLIRSVLDVIGAERARTHLAAALAIEAQGGMMTRDQSRRRTPGGLFFHLVREGCSEAEREQLWPRINRRKGIRSTTAPPSWAVVEKTIAGLVKGQGGEAIVKVTLIGRPLRVATVGESVLCQMEGKPPGSMPKGLPLPPPTATSQSYAVFIALPAWKKVEASLKDPADALIVEGWPYMDAQRGLFIVLAQSVTTKLQQRAKRAQAEK